MAHRIRLGIFISFVAFLLMSHNAFAVELTPAVAYKTGYVLPYWSDNHNRPYATGGYNYSTNGDYENADILYFKSGTNTNISVNAGNYVSLTGDINITVSSSSQAVSIQANPRQYFVIGTGNVDCPVLSFDETSFQQTTTNSNNVWVLRYTFTSICRLRSNVSQNVAMNISLRAPSASGTDTLRFVPTYLAIWEPVDGYDDTDVINAINALSRAIADLGDKLDDLGGRIDDINQDSADATQDSADQAQQDADSSSQDVDNTTQSLGSALTSISGALISAPATNCNINTNNSRLSLGTLNLCSNVPSNVLTLVSNIIALVFTPIVLYFAYNVITLLYQTFKEYFG